MVHSRASPPSATPQKTGERYAKNTKLSGVLRLVRSHRLARLRTDLRDRGPRVGVILVCTECYGEVARFRYDDVAGLSAKAILAGLEFVKGPVIQMAERLSGDIYCSTECVDAREVKGALAK